MKVTEIRELTNQELLAEIEECKRNLFQLRFQQAVGQLENSAQIREVRKTVARIKTVLKERENIN